MVNSDIHTASLRHLRKKHDNISYVFRLVNCGTCGQGCKCLFWPDSRTFCPNKLRSGLFLMALGFTFLKVRGKSPIYVPPIDMLARAGLVGCILTGKKYVPTVSPVIEFTQWTRHIS